MDCDVTNTIPLPNVQWFNPAGQIVAVVRLLMIENIQRSQSGTYTCLALQSSTGINMTSIVDVTVQCKCVCKMCICMHVYISVIVQSRILPPLPLL